MFSMNSLVSPKFKGIIYCYVDLWYLKTYVLCNAWQGPAFMFAAFNLWLSLLQIRSVEQPGARWHVVLLDVSSGLVFLHTYDRGASGFLTGLFER